MKMYAKNMLCDTATLDVKAQLHIGSTFHQAHEAGPYIWRPPERDCIYFMQLATFIMENQSMYITVRCALCRMDMGKDECQS